MTFLAEQIIGLLLEDRIDDIIAKNPKMKLDRNKLTKWMEFDPTNNKKYFNWIIKQVVLKKAKLPKDGERIRDNLMRFERLLVIPAFTGQRDINQYDAKTLDQTIIASAQLQSKTAKEKEERYKNVNIVGKAGNITVVEIKNTQELMNRAWSAYGKDNPNWTGQPQTPPKPGEDRQFSDGLWCVRFPQYASSYLGDGPFYMVYKNGGVYAGIVFERGECQTLNNKGIDLGMAEEIYPALKDILASKAKEGAGLDGNCSIFINMRFLTGEAKDGETVSGRHNILDLSFSTLTHLPDNLTVKGTLDLTGCPIAQLPFGLTVQNGPLKIAGTKITVLPVDMKITEMEWSEPLTIEEIKKQFYRMRLGDMKNHFWKSDKLYVPELDANGQELTIPDPKGGVNQETGQPKMVPKPKLGPDGNTIPMDEEQKELKWIEFQPQLIKYFMTDEKIANTTKQVLRYKSPTKIQRGDRDDE